MDRETVKEIKRHVDVVEIAAVAARQGLLTERLDWFSHAVDGLTGSVGEFSDRTGGLTGRVDGPADRFEALRTEMREQFHETGGTIRSCHGRLEPRIVDLETGMDDLRTRMERVESRLTS